MNYPLVTVIIPTHKRPLMLMRAVSSVLNQTYSNIEIIIVDDGSNDSTYNVVNKLIEMNIAKIKYIKNETPMGACFARNRGIENAEGEFITGLDDDDEFTYDRIEKLLEFYDDKYSFMCSNYKIISKAGNRIIKSSSIINFEDILWKNSVGPQILVKKERILSINAFNEKLPSAQDYDMWIRLIKEFGPAKNVDYPLYYLHTEHDKPRITNSSKKINGYTKVYLLYKKYMSKKQRIYNILNLRKLRNKKLILNILLKLFPNQYFFKILITKILEIVNYKRINN